MSRTVFDRAWVRWSTYVLIAAAFAVACGYLSHWQFTRNADRSAQLQLVADNYDAAPVNLAEAVSATGDFDPAMQWHPVVVRGVYLADRQLVARNRPHGGTSAFEVLTPLRLDDGRILVVDRGWVPPADSDVGPDLVPDPPSGPVTVVVRILPGEALPPSGRSAPSGQVPTIHLPLIAESAGTETITSAYGRMVSEDPAAAITPAPLEPPSEDPGPHLSYAVQWILFAVMGFVFIGYIIRTELTRRREDAVEPATSSGRAPPPAPERRRDRDAQDEDDLLDRIGR